MILDNVPDELKIYELSLIWKEAEYNFAFWERLNGSVDWDKAYKTALSAVLKTTGLYEYYLELMKFTALLRDGHTDVWFPKEIEKPRLYAHSAKYTSKLPIRTQLIGGERVIVGVKRCAADKVKLWSVIKKINGVDTEQYAEQNIYPYMWHEKKDSIDYAVNNFLSCGAEGSVVELEVEYDGVPETITLTRTKGDKDWSVFFAPIKPSEHLKEEYGSASHRIEFTNDNIAVITIDTFGNDGFTNEFFANFALFEKARGYIIDVRNNGGGNSPNADAAAAVFIGGEFTSQRALHPKHVGAHKAWGVYAENGGKTNEYNEEVYTAKIENLPGVLTAPLIVLSSGNTASAAEGFLVALDYAKRITIVGTNSCGSTGQPLFFNFESGGGCRICTRHNTYPDGREFINIGVKPHVPFELTLDDYKNGIDAVMNKGLEVMRKMW